MQDHVERQVFSGWLQDNNTNSTTMNWSTEDLNGFSLPKSAFSSLQGNDDFFDKVNDEKSALDVEDLSLIFEELDGGVVDFPLPCDEEDVAIGKEVTSDWISDLDKDAMNVEELSAAFDVLASEQSDANSSDTEVIVDKVNRVINGYSTSEYDEDESMEGSDDDEEDDVIQSPVQYIPTAPTWAVSAPLDPRSTIRTPVFKNLDARIPRVNIPRIDLGFGHPILNVKPVLPVAPRSPVKVKSCGSEYKHDPATCWICKSDKTPYKKFALHRYLEKRHRRNWKRGPRYSGRSNVATGRVREGGRFVCTAHWV